MREEVEERIHCSKSGSLTLKDWVYRDAKGRVMRTRTEHPPFLDFGGLEVFWDEVLSPLMR